jgi:hypothetical protein
VEEKYLLTSNPARPARLIMSEAPVARDALGDQVRVTLASGEPNGVSQAAPLIASVRRYA